MDSFVLSDIQCEKLKQCELEIFKQFISICDELNLRYFVAGGTLLGAVRHGGFIPWDDDIDVLMPRKDYERFLREAQARLPEFYFLQTFRTDPEFPANFAKIRDSRTTFIETSVSKHNIHHGVYIDIFPLDYYPDKLFLRLILELRKNIMQARMSAEFYRPNERISVKMIMRIIAGSVSRLLYRDRQNMQNKRERMFRSVPVSGLVCNYSGAWGKREICPVEWISETCELVFEGLKVSAPRKYDKLLTHLYDDYMKLPPVEKRISHHFATVIDLDKPYTEYLSLRNSADIH